MVKITNSHLQKRLKALDKMLHPMIMKVIKGESFSLDEFKLNESEQDELSQIEIGIKILLEGLQDELEQKKETIQNLERLNQELRNSNKKLEEFAFTMSHDLKSPLTNFMALITLLQEAESQEESNEIISHLEDNAQAMSQQINDLIEIIKQKGKPHQVEKNDIHKLLTDVLKGFDTDLSDAIQVEINEKNWYYIKHHLISLFQNLISNSVKYQATERPLKIKITTQQNGPFLEIDYTDNGMGLNIPNDLDKLFGLFKRAHDNVEGKGLGMYMVKRNIEDLGGKIHVWGQPNKGLHYKITLKNLLKNTSSS